MKIIIFDTEILQVKIVEKEIKNVITLWLHFFVGFIKLKQKFKALFHPIFYLKKTSVNTRKFDMAKTLKRRKTKVKNSNFLEAKIYWFFMDFSKKNKDKTIKILYIFLLWFFHIMFHIFHKIIIKKM